MSTEPKKPLANLDVAIKPLLPFPTLQQFCVEFPLYHFHSYASTCSGDVGRFAENGGSIDCYCHGCGQHSTFRCSGQDLGFVYQAKDWEQDRTFMRVFTCSRVSAHTIYFVFLIHARKVAKIGQFPSLADLSHADLKPYAKALTEDQFKELKTGVGLAAHGVGIGSFVYLRRIFEALIEEARLTAATDANWNNDEFLKLRMAEKIQALHSHLPPFLVENKALYSILSSGIHTLSERDCLDAFPAVRTGIELILDQKLVELNRKKKEAEARRVLTQLGQKFAAQVSAETSEKAK